MCRWNARRGGRAPRPQAEVPRLDSASRSPVRHRVGLRSERRFPSRPVSRGGKPARLPCTGGSLSRRRSGACRQGRVAARPLRRRDRPRSLADRPEPHATSSGSSASSFDAREACSRARSGRSTRCSRRSRVATGAAGGCSGDAERAVVVRRVVDAGPDDAGRTVPRDIPDALGRALAELDGALLDADDLDEPLASFVRAYRDELDRLDAWDRGDAPSPGDRAADRRPRRRGATARCSCTASRTSPAPSGASSRRSRRAPTSIVSLPYEPGRAAYASLARTAERPRGARRRRRSSSCRRARPSTCRRRWRTSSAQLFEPTSRARAARRRDPLPRGSRDARDARARRGGGAGRDPRRDAPGGDRGRLPVARRDARSARDGVRRARRPAGVRGADRAPRDAVRAFAAVPASLRLARRRAARSCTRTCARRTRGSSGGRWTGSRASFAAAASCAAIARSEVTAELRGGRPLPLLDLARGDDSPVETVRARRGARCCATRTAPSRRRSAHASRVGPPGPRRRHARARRARGARGEQAGEIGRRDVLAALERATVPRRARRCAGPGRGHRPAASAHAALRHRLRARARAGNASAPCPRRAVPRRGLAPHARGAPRCTPRAARCREPRPLPLRDRVHAPTAAARARTPGRRRRGHPARAEPVLGGSAGALRRGRRPPPDGPPAALRAHPGARGGADRARAPARARARSRRPSPPRPRRSPHQNGWDRRLRRATRAFDRPTRRHARARAAASWAAGTRTPCPTSSGWRPARRRGSSSATCGPATIDKEVDRMLRGSILHSALQRFYQQLPSAIPGRRPGDARRTSRRRSR